MQTGSVINMTMRDCTGLPSRPLIGDGATMLMWTDRHACTITHVSPSGKTLTVQEDRAIRVDDNGQSEMQTYRFERNYSGAIHHVRLCKDGRWRSKGTPFAVGLRSEYRDPSF